MTHSLVEASPPKASIPNAFTLAICGVQCDHNFQGWREFEGGGEAVCTKCGSGAAETALWND